MTEPQIAVQLKAELARKDGRAELRLALQTKAKLLKQ
jgi:hypothetical protein